MSGPERSSDPVERADLANEGGRRERALMVAGVLLGTVMLATAGILVSGDVATKQLDAIHWPGAPSASAAVESRLAELRRPASPAPSSAPASASPPSSRPASALPPSSRPGRSARRTTTPSLPSTGPSAVSTRPNLVRPGEPAASPTPAPVRPSAPTAAETLLSVLPPLTDATAPVHTPPSKTRKPRKPRRP
ncbi:hypothetical protein [Nonomuraea sp. NPDC049695]|uniref:hypothetical protein n=1 Tax=Nonomuraea sp. NPDC049695 TaxID=3154734 RepID=UPI00342120D8